MPATEYLAMAWTPIYSIPKYINVLLKGTTYVNVIQICSWNYWTDCICEYIKEYRYGFLFLIIVYR